MAVRTPIASLPVQQEVPTKQLNVRAAPAAAARAAAPVAAVALIQTPVQTVTSVPTTPRTSAVVPVPEQTARYPYNPGFAIPAAVRAEPLVPTAAVKLTGIRANISPQLNVMRVAGPSAVVSPGLPRRTAQIAVSEPKVSPGLPRRTVGATFSDYGTIMGVSSAAAARQTAPGPRYQPVVPRVPMQTQSRPAPQTLLPSQLLQSATPVTPATSGGGGGGGGYGGYSMGTPMIAFDEQEEGALPELGTPMQMAPQLQPAAAAGGGGLLLLGVAALLALLVL